MEKPELPAHVAQWKKEAAIPQAQQPPENTISLAMYILIFIDDTEINCARNTINKPIGAIDLDLNPDLTASTMGDEEEPEWQE